MAWPRSREPLKTTATPLGISVLGVSWEENGGPRNLKKANSAWEEGERQGSEGEGKMGETILRGHARI